MRRLTPSEMNIPAGGGTPQLVCKTTDSSSSVSGRIMIAHRPQTIAIADRIVRLEQGRFVDVTAGTAAGQRQLGETEKSLRPV